MNKTAGLEIVFQDQAQIFSPHLNASSFHRIWQAPRTHSRGRIWQLAFTLKSSLLWDRNILQQNQTPAKTTLRQEIQNYKMPKSEILIQFAFCKHFQVIVSRPGCSSSKRLTRNWTVVAIMFFLWRALPGLFSLRFVKSHCSELMAPSIRPQLMHFPTPASVCIPCVRSAGILLRIFAVPCLWCIRRSRRGSSAHFPGSCLQLCAFPQTHEPRTWPWAWCTAFSLIGWSPMSQRQYLLKDACSEQWAKGI